MKRSSLFVILLLGAGVLALLLHTGSAPAQTKFLYNKEECVKCHAARVNDIAEAGGKHRSVPCMGCHPGHPPEVQKPIAQCSKCHWKTKKAHFEVVGCLNCHTNPHTPRKISFKGKDACLNCHGPQIAQLRGNKSKHSLLDCFTCHDVHRKVPLCTQCHKPHAAEMVVTDCKKCHRAHMPVPVTYAGDLPSKYCGACHSNALKVLSASKAKHGSFSCAFCHKEKHKMVPACQNCHGSPHPAGIMRKFSKCGMCHNIAHDLNNWTETETRGATEQAPKKPPLEQPAR